MSGGVKMREIGEIREIWCRLGESEAGLAEVEPLAGDGSQRLFYRCRQADTPSRLLVLPGRGDAQGLAEAAAAEAIGRHLAQAGVPVPRIYAFAPESGALLMEDLGDLLLHGYLQSRPPAARITLLYRQAIDLLLTLQIEARPDFPLELCWDTRHYDRPLMVERESGYFYQALGREWLGWGELSDELAAEFALLAELTAAQPADFVLHRDYQSRNLMLQGERLRVIDFQGARLGPLAYDLAALLNDPYAALSSQRRNDLFNYYLDRAALLLPSFDRREFQHGWYFVALQRNLQILGAFAFLTNHRGKTFFKNYLQPAAIQLSALFAEMPEGDRFPQLRYLAQILPSCLKRTLESR